jgi:hypothetical protein
MNLELKPGQDTLVQQMYECLQTRPFLLNTSGTGSGKTIMTAYLAYLTGHALFVVAPSACKEIWNRMRSHVDIVDVLSYEALRGSRSMQPKHGYLRRVHTVTPNMTISVRYSLTPKLHALTQRRVMLVIDESHKTKNDSLQGRACAELIQHFMQMGKVVLLSATPFDHMRHVVSLFRLLGIMRSPSLFTRRGTPTGMHEVVAFCTQLDAKATQDCVGPSIEYERAVGQDLCLRLWSSVIAPRHVFAMSQRQMFTNFGEHKDIKNLYCAIDSEEFQKGLRALRGAVTWQLEQKVGAPRINFGMVVLALMQLEAAKLPTLIKLIRQDLFLRPKSKIIVLCSYRKTITSLCEAFQAYSPLRYEGGMKSAAAEQTREAFQSPSLDRRLFFGNINKGELGIDLHDVHGSRPRIMYLIPTYRNPHQAIGRVYRSGLLSEPKVRFVYGREQTEARILQALAKIKVVMQHTLPQQKADNVVFPGEYTSMLHKECVHPTILQLFPNGHHHILWVSNHTHHFLVIHKDKDVSYVWGQDEKELLRDSSFMHVYRSVYAQLGLKFRSRMQARITLLQNYMGTHLLKDLGAIILDYYDLDLDWFV